MGFTPFSHIFHIFSPELGSAFASTRALSEALVEPLSDADATIQSMEDASPAKWHLAHTTWFWETFLLREHSPGYTLFDERWPFIHNSYYEAEGERIARFSRGMLSRPTLDEILDAKCADGGVRTVVTEMLDACGEITEALRSALDVVGERAS